MKKTIFLFSLLLAAALTLSGCSAPSSHQQKKQARQGQGKGHSCHQDSDCQAIGHKGVHYKCQQGKCAAVPLTLKNPASVYCGKHGGRLEMKKSPQGEYGVCHFKDGSECEEWKFFRGQCHKGEHFSASPTANAAKGEYLKGYLKKNNGEWFLVDQKGKSTLLGFKASSGPEQDLLFFLNKNCENKKCAATMQGDYKSNFFVPQNISLKNYPNLLTYFQEAREKIKEKYPHAASIQLERVEILKCLNCYDLFYRFSLQEKEKAVVIRILNGRLEEPKEVVASHFYSCQTLLKKGCNASSNAPVCAHLLEFVPCAGRSNCVVSHDVWQDFTNPCVACHYKKSNVSVIGYYYGHCSALPLK